MNLAVRDELIVRSPANRLGELMRRVRRRVEAEVSHVASWTPGEVASLLAIAREDDRKEGRAAGVLRFYPALLFLLSTGARRGEVLGLKWEDVDFERRRIHIRRAIVRGAVTTPKSGRGRLVAMPPGLASVLFDLLAERRAQALRKGWPQAPEWVFCSEAGGRSRNATSSAPGSGYGAGPRRKLTRLERRSCRTPRQESLARISAAYISFSTARSPKACGMSCCAGAPRPNKPLEQIGGPRRLAMRERQAQMRDAGVEVVEEAAHRRRQLALPGVHHLIAQDLCESQTRRGVTAPGLRLELRPAIGRYLGLEVAHPVRQAALAQALRPAFLERPDQPRRAVGGAEQRIVQAPVASAPGRTPGSSPCPPWSRARGGSAPSCRRRRMPQAQSTASRGWPGANARQSRRRTGRAR